MAEVRSVHWWRVFLESKLIGWQLRLIIFQGYTAPPLTLAAIIQKVEVQKITEREYGVTLHIPRVGLSRTENPYNWQWSDYNQTHEILLSEAELHQIEEADPDKGDFNFAMKRPEVAVLLIPPNSDTFVSES